MGRRLLAFLTVLIIFMQVRGQQDIVSVKHNPKVDHNLSPAYNERINPIQNASINPSFNWNYNPIENKSINPDSTDAINPLRNPNLNAKAIEIYNPLLNYSLNPRNYTWRGRYMFDSTDNLVGFITEASQNILLCFNKEGIWTCYFVKTSKGTYNQFKTTGEWTGKFLCPDSVEGYNLFSKEGVWTGMHLK
jgi:hypothetical protein